MLTRRSCLAAVPFGFAARAGGAASSPAIGRITVRGGRLHAGGQAWRCAIGHGGIRAAKQEGDGATPVGVFPLREVFYRPDRVARPSSGLPVRALSDRDGWCDAPADPAYNRLVVLPYGAHHEELWRADTLYDLFAVIGFNDSPVVPGKGSAIFLHVASPVFGATDGCVAIAEAALVGLLAGCDARTLIDIA